MITEEQKGYLVAHLASSVEWRYPLSGAYQFDFNKEPMVYRRGEPINKEYPLIEVSFLPRSDAPVRGLGDVIKDYSGALVYGYGELEPIIITAYTHQICEGSQSAYHGKIVADEYIRRIERYIRRYWPRMLQTMEAYIYKPMSFLVNDISEFLQGDEKQGTVDYAKALLTFYEEGITIEDSTATIHEFGNSEPPFKKMFVNFAILMTSVLAGMLVALNIIEEKVDKTIRAIHLSPVSRSLFIVSKSIIGILLPIYGAVVIVIITGYSDINWLQMIIMVMVVTIISLLVGFIQGVNNDDVMSAISAIKILMMPMMASIAAIEFLSQSWQPWFYWIPFYWAYKGTSAVLSYTATWADILLYAGIVLAISALVYVILAPRIRKGLE